MMDYLRGWRTLASANPDSLAFFNASSPMSDVELRFYTPVMPQIVPSINNQTIAHVQNRPILPTLFDKQVIGLNVSYATMFGGGVYVRR